MAPEKRKRKPVYLTVQTALPLNKNPENRTRSELGERPHLSTHKLTLLIRTLNVVRKAAQYSVERFEPYQNMLWWQPTDKEGKPQLDKEGKPVIRIAGELPVVLKLRQVAPLKGFSLPAALRDGIYYKVADSLLSYAQRMLDPNFADKTTYPNIGDSFPAVWQMGFQFLEHADTGKLFVYVPLFPRGGHEELLGSHFNPAEGPRLQRFGSRTTNELARPKNGLLLPLEFDKWGEATFIRDPRNPPLWNATHRPYDRRWALEVLRKKEFLPRRLELFMRGNRLHLNITCEVVCKPAVETETFMGVAFGIHDLVNVVVINANGQIIHQRKVTASKYYDQVFSELSRSRKERRGKFHQRLDQFLHARIQEVVEETMHFKSVIAVEQVGNIQKGKYSPRMNRRLSFWPFGKLADMIGYKVVLEGLPKPYGVYSASVRSVCSACHASNKKGQEENVALEGALYFCGACNTKGNSGFNAALNLAWRAQELSRQGVVAR